MNHKVYQLNSQTELSNLIDRLPKQTEIKDNYLEMFQDWFIFKNPQYYSFTPAEQQKIIFQHHPALSSIKQRNLQGRWVHYPSHNLLLHLLEERQYFELRTCRNLNLLTAQELQQIHNSTIAIAGLSSGKNIANALVRYGVGREYNLADYDQVEISNFNRATFSLPHLYQPKTKVVQTELHEIDPYLTINIFPQGLNSKNLSAFLSNVKVVIDAFDSFPLKLKLRQYAKKLGIPVVSGADIEKGILLIVERYDIDQNLTTDLFLNKLNPADLKKATITKKDVTEFFIQMIGKELHSPKMLNSVYEVGSTLTSYPQLIIASQLLSVVVTHAVEQILLQKDTRSYRAFLDIPKSLKTID